MPEEKQESFFQNKSAMMSTALILSLLSLFLIVWGAFGPEFIFWLGTAMLFAGLFLAPLSRYTAGKKEEQGEEGEEEGGSGKGDEESPGKEQGE